MPWYKSFENISKLLILVAGLALLFMGNVETGLALLTSSGILMMAKAQDNKKNGAGTTAALFLVGILALGGISCNTLNQLPAQIVDLNLQVYDVHDSYVVQDSSLSDLERQQLLERTIILRDLMQLLKSGVSSLELLNAGK